MQASTRIRNFSLCCVLAFGLVQAHAAEASKGDQAGCAPGKPCVRISVQRLLQKLKQGKTRPTSRRTRTNATRRRAGTARPDAQAKRSAQRRARFQARIQEARRFRHAARLYLQEQHAWARHIRRLRRRKVMLRYDASLRTLDRRHTLKRDSAILRLTAFLRKYPGVPKVTPDAMIRLAELLYEKEYEAYLVRAGRYERALKQASPNAQETQAPRKRFVLTTGLLRQLVGRFPAYRYAPQAYYLLGYCYNEAGQDKAAVAVFREIVKRYPTRPTAIEAWIRLGEHFFNTARYKQARLAYAKAVQSRKHPLYDKALYKLAWTHYLLDAFDEAVRVFGQLLQHYRKQRRSRGELRREAIQYMAISFVDERWGGLRKTFATLKKLRLSRQDTRAILLALARTYRQQGNWNAVVATHQGLLRFDPTHPQNPTIQAQTIQLLTQRLKLQRAMLARRAFGQMFGKHSAWHKKNATNAQAIRRLQQLSTLQNYRAAVVRHELCQNFLLRAQSAKTAAARAKMTQTSRTHCLTAARRYRSFLREAPQSPLHYKVTWYLADSLYQAKAYRRAARWFRKVRDWQGEQRFRLEASFSLVAALDKQVHIACRKGLLRRDCYGAKHTAPHEHERPKTTTADKPLPIPTLQRELIDARKHYLRLALSSDKRAPGQLFLLMRTFFAYRCLKHAADLSWAFLLRFPQHALRADVGEYLLASYARRRQVDKMLKAIRFLKGRQALDKSAEQKATYSVWLQRAKALHQAKMWRAAAKAYERLYAIAPKHRHAAPALWNAALLYEKGGAIRQKARILEKVARAFPRWRLAGKARLNAAIAYEKLLAFEKARRLYQEIARSPHLSKRLRDDARFNLGQLLQSTGKELQAAQHFARWATRFPQQPKAPQRLLRAAILYKNQRRWQKVLHTTQKLLRWTRQRPIAATLQLRALALRSEAFAAKGRPQRQQSALSTRILRTYRKLASTDPNAKARLAPIAASAAYQQAMHHKASFLKRTIRTRNPRAQKRRLQDKLKRFKLLEQRFFSVMAFKAGPWTLCALTQLAHAKQNIIDTVRKMPLPHIPGLRWTPTTIADYKDKLDQLIIMKLEDQTKKLLQRALHLSQRVHDAPHCTNSAKALLRRIDPNAANTKPTHPQTKTLSLPPTRLIKSLQKKP